MNAAGGAISLVYAQLKPIKLPLQQYGKLSSRFVFRIT